MEFSVNHPILYLLVGLLVAVALGQSVFFLVKALRRSKQIGMDQSKIKKTIKTAAFFTIAPAVSIVISVITLSKSLGLPLPWLRLSVVGSLSYEAIAASNAVSAMGLTLGKIENLTAQQFVNITLVMTISIMMGIWLVPAIGKKLLGGMSSLENRDKKWAEIFQNAMFIGMIAAFLGFVFCDISRLWTPGDYSATSGLIPVCVLLAAAVVMVICGLLMKKTEICLAGRLRTAYFSDSGYGCSNSHYSMAGLRRETVWQRNLYLTSIPSTETVPSGICRSWRC